jgi:hypothetical protein
MRSLISFILAASLAHAAKPPPAPMLEAIQAATEARIALCRTSLIDELQIVQGPRKLEAKELREIAAILGSESSYKNDDLKKFCVVIWDFKVALYDEKGNRLTGVRICTTCRDVGIELNFESKGGGELTAAAMAKLEERFTTWFPDWRRVVRENREKRERW